MILYFICALISAFFLMLYLKYDKKKKILLIFSFLPLFLVSAFRHGIGYDYFRIYVPMFNQVISGGTVSWDLGTIALCKIISIFSDNYIWFFVFTSFIIMYYFFKGFLNISDAPVLLLLLFVFSGEYINSLNAIRQYISLAIFIYSLRFILNNNFKKYVLYIFVASLFHSSAIFLLPIYFLPKLKLGVKKQFLVIIITLISIPVLSKLFNYVLLFTKYSKYLNSTYNVFDPSYSELLMSVIIYLFCTFFYKKFSSDEKFRLFFNLLLIYLLISVMSFKIILAYRLVMYFRIFQILILAHISSKIFSFKKRIVFNLFWILFFAGITLVGGYVFLWYDVDYVSIFNGGN